MTKETKKKRAIKWFSDNSVTVDLSWQNEKLKSWHWVLENDSQRVTWTGCLISTTHFLKAFDFVLWFLLYQKALLRFLVQQSTALFSTFLLRASVRLYVTGLTSQLYSVIWLFILQKTYISWMHITWANDPDHSDHLDHLNHMDHLDHLFRNCIVYLILSFAVSGLTEHCPIFHFPSSVRPSRAWHLNVFW